MLLADILLVLLTTAVLICSIRRAVPRPFCDPPRHVLICCAHSDDCVITGAEYAHGTLQERLSVRIVYLTCSGAHPDTEIARTRKAEALAAWSAVGVPEESLTFINLSKSPVSGPLSYSGQDIAYAAEVFKALILSMPPNSAMIVPAQGESHVDHRTVRRISLLAVFDAKREDITVYETPEYNAFLSLVRCPKRAIRAVLRHVPALNRLVEPYAGPSNYVEGSAGMIFRDTPTRLAKKKELLRYFSSQDGNLLVHLFGYATPYRRLTTPASAPKTAWCISAFGGCCDPSTLALAASLLGITFLTAHEIARGLIISLSPEVSIDKYLLSLGALAAGATVVRRFRRTVNLESSLFAGAVALGVIIGAL